MSSTDALTQEIEMGMRYPDGPAVVRVSILIALEGYKVKECIVVTCNEVATGIRRRLVEIYGGANVALFSRAIDDVPLSLWCGYTDRLRQAAIEAG